MSTGSRTAHKGGFTLIEMMIVVGIILLVATMVVWNFAGQVRPQRVRSTAAALVSYLEICRTEAMRQQIFPYLLTQVDMDYSSGVTELPRYWPFTIQMYTFEENGTPRKSISVVACKPNGGAFDPTPADLNPSDHSADLVPVYTIPEGVTITNYLTGEEITFSNAEERPIFWKRAGNPVFVVGNMVGGSAGIVVADMIEPDMRVIIRIDPIYGNITMEDETK
ncbi:MAG: hypothetical protein Kow00107_02410 [Planctomycetota bacterium]